MTRNPFRGLLLAAAAASLALAAAQPAQAAGVVADMAVRVNGSYAGTNALGSVSFGFDQKLLGHLDAGTTTGKADKLYAATVTISASSSQNLDLAGTLTDPLGATLTFGHVKWIYVKASAANTNNFCIGGAASAGFLGPFSDATDIVRIKPGAVFFTMDPGAGWAVTATTADILKSANSGAGTPVSADVIIAGTSS